MNDIRVLIIYSRDIDINDAGGSRTTIQLANYISNTKGFKCYTLFNIIKGKSDNVIEITGEKVSKNNLIEIVTDKKIDIILIPEGYQFTTLVREAIEGTNCKIVSALHSMPGYEKMRFHVPIIEAVIYDSSFIKKLKAIIKLFLYPIYTKNIQIKMRNAYVDSDAFVLLSKSYFKEFEDKYKVEKSNKLVAIGNALSFDSFATEEEVYYKKKKQILVVSRLDEWSKRLSLVLKSWKLIQDKYPDWNLTIVGSGSSLKSYQRLSKKLKLKRISFEGQQDPESYYKESAIFLMTSAIEGWAMTITEAQQFGCVPIVMDSFSAVNDIIINNKNGIISPNADIEAYVSNIRKLMDNNDFRIEVALNAIESSKRFKKEIVCQKWIRLFKKLT